MNQKTDTKGGDQAKKKRNRPQSAKRVAAELAYKAAKSEQEKAAARGAVKIVRFQEIVVPRVNRALAVLDGIAKMANRNAYTWSDEEAAKICAAINGRAKIITDKFNAEKAKKEVFSL